MSVSCLWKKLPRTKMEWTRRRDGARFFPQVDEVAFSMTSFEPSEQIESSFSSCHDLDRERAMLH